MDDDSTGTTDHWFNSTFLVLNESYQLDLRRLLLPDTCELIHALSSFYMYDPVGVFLHLLGVASHYLTPSSSVYVDNQLKHRLNLHLLLVVRAGYERTSLVEHIKQSMSNVQCIRQTGQPWNHRHTFNPSLFCQSEDSTSPCTGLCLSERFDEHVSVAHLQRQRACSVIGTSNGHHVRKMLEAKFHQRDYLSASINTDWLMIFAASKARLFCRRTKVFDPDRYPSLDQWILVISCHCSTSLDFYFDEPQANQYMCEYLDALSLKAISLEETHPWMSTRYLSAREHVLRTAVALHVIESTIETLIAYRRTFHTFAHVDKVFFDNCSRLIEQTRVTTSLPTGTQRVSIRTAIVQSAIYLVNTSLKQYEIMFEPNLSSGTTTAELSSVASQPAAPDRPWVMRPSSSPTFPPHNTSPSSSSSTTAAVASAPKRLKPYVDPSYVKSLELAHELLLLPFVAFTRTSVYANSKLKRNAAYLDSVIDELKKHRLLLMVRQGVQMVDGTRRRVDLLVKSVPSLKDDESGKQEKFDDDLLERLGRFGVDYDRYIQTLGTLDIGDKYRLSDQCFELLSSTDYKRYLTVDLERIAPLHRVQQQHHSHSIPQEETHGVWMGTTTTTSSSSSSIANIKHEPIDFYS